MLLFLFGMQFANVAGCMHARAAYNLDEKSVGRQKGCDKKAWLYSI
jgi:hypothetical protein